ncbi:MAG: heme ABC exporter ATP-binding protein CcmA [Pseudomonadota bacterium]
MLALAGVSAVRGGRTLFTDFNLTLAAGGAAVVRGPNGAGKTTLLRIAAGLLTPGAGQVTAPERIGWLGDAGALDGERSVRQALLFWARTDGAAEPDARVAAAMAAVGLGERRDVPVRLLSQGQRRRAGLAQVIAGGAPLWVLDEPANGLDSASVAALEAALAAHRANGGTVLIATHQPVELPDAEAVMLG